MISNAKTDNVVLRDQSENITRGGGFELFEGGRLRFCHSSDWGGGEECPDFANLLMVVPRF